MTLIPNGAGAFLQQSENIIHGIKTDAVHLAGKTLLLEQGSYLGVYVLDNYGTQLALS